MIKMSFYNHKTVWSTYGIVFLIATACSGCGGSEEDNYKNLTCADFTTQESAQYAYSKGARQLDRDGDGIACDIMK